MYTPYDIINRHVVPVEILRVQSVQLYVLISVRWSLCVREKDISWFKSSLDEGKKEKTDKKERNTDTTNMQK